ncbi:hypothetical protein [Nostoc sp.]
MDTRSQRGIPEIADVNLKDWSSSESDKLVECQQAALLKMRKKVEG